MSGGGKVTRHWVDLDYNSPDAVSADVIPYDSTSSIYEAIGTGVEAASSSREIENFELTTTDISNQYLTLSNNSVDEEIDFNIIGGVAQIYNYDFKLIPIGITRTKISWSPLDVYAGMVGDLQTGDVVKVTYTKKGS
jgi:hypothetical protein